MNEYSLAKVQDYYFKRGSNLCVTEGCLLVGDRFVIGKIESGIALESEHIFSHKTKNASKVAVEYMSNQQTGELDYYLMDINEDGSPFPNFAKLSSKDLEKLLSISDSKSPKIGFKVNGMNRLYWTRIGKIGFDNEIIELALGYQDNYDKIMEQCSSLEDVSRVIDNDSQRNSWIKVSDEVIALDYNRDLFEKDSNYSNLSSGKDLTKQRELLAKKAFTLYRALWEENDGDINKLKNLYNDGAIKSAIDNGVLLYAKIKGYNSNISNNELDTLEWLCNNCPSEAILINLKAIWTRAKLHSLISNQNDWPSFEEIFSSSNYCCINGIDPLRYNGRGTISTWESDYFSIKKRYLVSQLELLKNKETINGESFDKCIERFIGDADNKPSIESLTTMKNVLNDNLLKMDTDFKELETYQYVRNLTKEKVDKELEVYQNIRNQTKEKFDFVNVLISEFNGNANYEDYNSLSKTSSMSYKKYAERRLTELQKRRIERENAVREKTTFSETDIKLYEKFEKMAIEAERKKLTTEFVNSVKASFIDVAYKECLEAYKIYPVGKYSDIYMSSKEAYEVSNIILLYRNGKNTLESASRFLKKYPQSIYKNLITDFYNDDYAVSEAEKLDCRSIYSDISRVQALPVTKEGEKKIKELTKKSYLKTKGIDNNIHGQPSRIQDEAVITTYKFYGGETAIVTEVYEPITKEEMGTEEYFKEVDAYWDSINNDRSDQEVIIETVREDSNEDYVTKRQKDIDIASQKYGKKYVDAMLNNKILIGTPEGLIVGYTNSQLIEETRIKRTYKIINNFGYRMATVAVDINTKKVIAVRY